MTHRIGVIGTGPDPENPDEEGYAMAYRHAAAYEESDRADLVACADIVREHAEAFAESHDLADDHVYEDYQTMLAEADLDMVSVCVPPAIHADIVVGCAESGHVDAIHCEKPMAATWGGARRMAAAAEDAGVQLTFNHQRRYGKPYRKAKELLDEGAIGDLQRVEFSCIGLYDYGSHCFDLSNYFNDETPPEWVLGQVHYDEENLLFGAHNENQAIAVWGYENGVNGFAATDANLGSGGPDQAVACHNRLIGTEGTIEVGGGLGADVDLPVLRYENGRTDGWQAVDTGEDTLSGPGYIKRAIADVLRCLDEGEEPELAARNALNATELIFGAWESARRRGRVDFPLDIDDNPLEAMVEDGQLTPEAKSGDD